MRGAREHNLRNVDVDIPRDALVVFSGISGLMDVLGQLKAAGNSLFVVEHDLAMMRRADWLVDVGPDAGEHGGRTYRGLRHP